MVEKPFTHVSFEQGVRLVPVRDLKPADSPRDAGEDPEHVRVLAQVQGDLPPILVHRGSMRVIDGMHRLHAARLRGDKAIEVRFVTGSDEAAFRLAVEANVVHGLPLTLAERKAAARRIIASHAHWADRAIAAVTGLSVKTVGVIRHATSPDHTRDDRRVGIDGRVRPLSAADGRLRAHHLIEQRPDASLREIARKAGISVSTAKDVRDRVRRGENPLPRGREKPKTFRPAQPEPVHDTGDAGRSREDTLEILRKDPTLRFTEAGRALLRWLVARTVAESDWTGLVDAVPTHTARLVADLARQHAANWARFAEELEQRSADGPAVGVPAQRTTR